MKAGAAPQRRPFVFPAPGADRVQHDNETLGKQSGIEAALSGAWSFFDHYCL